MAWRTKSGQTSDRDLEAATRRGTEPQTGIRNRTVERAKVQEQMDRVHRTAEALKRGDWHTAWYAD
jgi:hypothetical protein